MRSCILIFLYLLSITPSTFAAQTSQKNPLSIADLVEIVRPGVIQIAVLITDQGTPDFANLDSNIAGCFVRRKCVIGTAFFVNENGDAVTAAHVAIEAQRVTQTLAAKGIHASVSVGIPTPNYERGEMILSGNNFYFGASLVAIDPGHDIAVVHSETNPFKGLPVFVGGPGAQGVPKPGAVVLPLGSSRPRDAEEVFACGFPFGLQGLVTTSGTIGSAWNTENLLTAKANGITTPVEIYEADLRINPGNSGGPVMRLSDHAVIGIAVETKGTLDTVVPSKFIINFLKQNSIKWTSVEEPTGSIPTPDPHSE